MRGKDADRTVTDEIADWPSIPGDHRRLIPGADSMLERALETLNAGGDLDAVRLLLNPEASAAAVIAPQLDAYLDAHPDPRVRRP